MDLSSNTLLANLYCSNNSINELNVSNHTNLANLHCDSNLIIRLDISNNPALLEVIENGEYVSPNVVIAILLRHLLKKGYKGAVVKTVGSSLLIDRVAEKLGVEVIETAVGFKHVGEAMRKNQVIIGGEESGGLSILGHIPEKDGLIANLLVLEAMADSGKSLAELENDIYEFAGTRFYTDRIDLKLDSQEEIKPILEKTGRLKNIGKYGVTAVDKKDGVKLMLGDTTKILVRPSGTEPLLRIYFESDSESKLDELKNEPIVV